MPHATASSSQEGSQKITTVSQALADTLAQHCDHCFGLIGNANSHFTSTLTESGFGYSSVRHESAAVGAADAFHRAGGGLAIATATCGAGFTNALTTLAEARVARIPLIFAVGTHPERPRPFDLNQAALLDALDVCHRTVTPESALDDANFAVQHALRSRQPVVLLLPYDLQEAPITASASETQSANQEHLHTSRPEWLESTVTSLAAELQAAHRPLIIAGRGVLLSDTAELVRRIGDSVGALFMHSAMARHVLSSPWQIGTVGGFAHAWQVELARQADVVLFLGASFNAFQNRGGNMFAPDAKIIQVVDEPHPAAQPSVTPLLAKLEELLPVLAERLEKPLESRAQTAKDSAMGEALESSSSTWRTELKTLPTTAEVESLTCADGRLDPRACLQYLNRVLPNQRAVCTDGGHFLGWVPKFLDVPGPQQQVIVGTAIQSIGLGMGSLVGLAAARPEDYCVLVAGDGGGTMGIADLPAAIEQLRRGRGGCVVFINDAAYGAELHQFGDVGLDTSSMEIADYDFAAVGRAYGAHGFSVGKPEDFSQLDAYFHDVSNSDEVSVAVIDFKVSRLVVADFVKEVLAKAQR